MTKDNDLVKKLRAVDHQSVEDCFLQSPLYGDAADRIEQLVETNEALTEQLEAARLDAKEAEAYSVWLEKQLATCEKYRDAYAECDRIGTQAVRDLEAKLAKAAFDALIAELNGDKT